MKSSSFVDKNAKLCHELGSIFLISKRTFFRYHIGTDIFYKYYYRKLKFGLEVLLDGL